MKVLVTDGRERASLAVVRSLGRAGHRVEVASNGLGTLAGVSRYAMREHQVPDPLDDFAAYSRAVRQIASGASFDFLIPISEGSLHALLPYREAFRGTRIPFADHEVFDAVCDKARVHEVAADKDIPVPRQILASGPGGAVDAGERIGFPLVVKPSRSVVSSEGGRMKTNVRYARSHGELSTVLKDVPVQGYPVLVQERIEGVGTGVFLLLWNDELVASFCHRRIREKPPSGGVSVLRESVPLDPQLLELSRNLLDEFAWQGVAMVEYKRDRSTGRPYLMEINGRFWGSLQLAIDAGVDFPRLLVEAASGRAPDPVIDYETGVRTRWLLGDLDHLLARFRRSTEELGLGPEAPSRAAVLRDFLGAFGPASRNEVFRWDDPRPALRETLQWVRNVGEFAGAPASSPHVAAPERGDVQ